MPHDTLRIRGARQHNLKNINLEIPRDQLVVITGLSGSGKSSLAFDTIFAEGQRRYVESLSSYARQFLGQMDKPDVDTIEGLSPAVSIDQKSTTRNPRSTVGTVTEIYDYLRLLYARVGEPHCPECGKPIASQSAQQMVDAVMALPEGARIQVLAPMVRGRKGEYRSVIEEIKKDGFLRVRVDGTTYEVTDDIEMDRYKQHTIEAVVDRLVIKDDVQSRLADSVETALKLAKGLLGIHVLPSEGQPERELLFSEQFACAECGVSIGEIAPRNFSFNSPYGACPECHGLGVYTELDPDLVLDYSKSINGGGVIPFADTSSEYFPQMFAAIAKEYGFSLDIPLGELCEEQVHPILHGTKKKLPLTYKNRHGYKRSYEARFEGVLAILNRRYQESGSQTIKEDIEQYMASRPCPACKGYRLKPEALSVLVGNLNISQLTEMSIGRAEEFLSHLDFSERQWAIAERIIKEIRSRLGFLKNVGLNYLTLNRSANTLAGGEAQRIRLATQIGSGLMGVVYILDEPSIGLHQRDNRKLIDTLVRLRDLGNTILVVEHDEDTIRASDWVIDIGPGAGENGGHVVAEGTPEEVSHNPASVTGQFLSGERRIEAPQQRREPNGKWLELKGATQHNLKDVDVSIPLGCLVAVTGVSGSGKSTLVQETLYPLLRYKVYGTRGAIGRHRELCGDEHIDKVIDIDQSPIGRTPRSNPATYTGTFDLIRDLFAQTPEAKVRGYKPGRFSFNVKGGRCEACKGDGIIKIEMHFLPDVYVPCEVCKGQRFNRETLEVKFKEKNIAQVLDMTVSEALEFFDSIPPIKRKLSTLHDVGLDYIRLGQPATTLSGGEAQRIKLSSELSKRGTGRTIYILDEPTTGLHFADIEKLLEVLNRLVDNKNSVLVIEHNLDVIKTADYLIDMGPEGGEGGGEVVCAGTPEEVAGCEHSHTGTFLREIFEREGQPVEAEQHVIEHEAAA
ncbi:MAG: excinuclease ABC subunit UvrA [Armatimonadetes bacterium]|nr:excinuclease ABC subunit UvrA [Armatimonadota bacterium]